MMDDLRRLSDGTSEEGAALDTSIASTEATQLTPVQKLPLNNSLAAAEMNSEPLVEPENFPTLDTGDMAVGSVDKSTLGGDDQSQMVAVTNSSSEQNTSGKIASENERIEGETGDTEELGDTKAPEAIIEGTAELGVSGTSNDLDQDVDMTEVAAAEEGKKTLPASGQSEFKDEDSDMVETRKASDSIEATEETQTQTTETRADSPNGEIAEPSDKDKMEVDAPETEPLKTEEEVEEVETTDSKVWSLPSIIDDGCEPQLSLKQLLVMALVTSPTRTLSMEEICQWINDGFKYYKDLTFQHTLNPGTTYNWMEELNDILHLYDFPTEPILKPESDDGKVVIHLPPGREWHILPKPEKMKVKPFRFLDLPFDIRLMILEFALVRPLPKKQGWIIDPEYTAKRKENYRKARRTPQRLKALGLHGWELRTDGLDVVMAVFSVSNLVFKEAAPVFYRGNFLEFDSAVTSSRFLDGVPFRRKWIRNLVLHYDPPIHGHACSRAFTLLRETKLRNLHLFLNEDKLIKRHELTRFSDPIPRLPGMKVLAELRGLKKVCMWGPCAKTNKFLGKLLDWKKNDAPDDDEMVGLKRKKEQEKFQLALKRSVNDLRNANHRKAAEALKAKHTREKEVQKRKREGELKSKHEEVAKEKKAKMEARDKKRKEREEVKAKAPQAKATMQKHKSEKKNIKAILAKNLKKAGSVKRPADEDTISEEEENGSEEEDESSSEESESEEEESEEEDDVSPPPPKHAKTLPATSALAAAKRNAANKKNNNTGGRSSRFLIKPAPAPRSVVAKSATGVRSVTTKGGIVAKGSSGGAKNCKPAPVVKKAPVKKFASGSMKKGAAGKRKSDMASVFEAADDRVVVDSD